MNLKQLYLLTGILSVAAIITYFIKNADASLPVDPRVGEALVDNDMREGVTKIVIQGDEESFTIVHEPEADQWLMQEKHNLPVDNSVLGRAITSLTDAKIERLVSANPDRIDKLGFNGEGIIMYNADGDQTVHVQLGKVSDSGKQLVKYANEDKAFLASDAISLAIDPIDWLDKTLVDFEQDQMRSVTLTFPNGDSLQLSRDSATDDWTAESSLPDGKELNQGAITRAANRFADIRFTQLGSKDDDAFQAAMEHSHRYQIALEDESQYTFTIGRRPEKKVAREVESEDEEGNPVTETKEEVETPAGPVYLTIESSNAEDPINEYMSQTAFEVGSHHFTSLPKSLEDLLQDAPEPAAEAAEEAEAADQPLPAETSEDADTPAPQ